jgi:hypothetical protein
MSREHIEGLIGIWERRRRKLEEQQAAHGRDTPPEILMEIEDIKQVIGELKIELEKSEDSGVKDTSPKRQVHIYIAGDFSSLPDGRQSAAIDAFAAVVGIPPQSIEVYRVYEDSVIFELGIPSEAVERLHSQLQSNNAQLRLLRISRIKLERESGETEEWVFKRGRLTLSVEFVNRARELEMICNPGAPRFVVIDGAAGYGKTYLLRKIKETYQGYGRPVWKVALIDLKSDPQMRSTDSNVVWPCIAKAIIRQFEPVHGGAPTTSELAGGAISSVLVAFLARQAANILLLFDGVEILQRDTSGWLKRLIADVDRGLQRVPRELRAVFAGRYAGDWGRGAPYAMRHMPLSPFDRVAVRDMVEQVALASGVQATPDYLAELAGWLLDISGGHPRGICEVLDVISAAGFIFPDLEFVFLEMQFQVDGQRGTLFELCIKPIIEELLQGVDASLREVLATISPIRRFDVELLDALLDRGVFAAPGYLSSWDLIRALLKTRLISPPTDNPMYSDQIVRRMLAMQLQIKDPERFREINACAQDIFHRWALDSKTVRADIRRVASLESLYHTLQLEPQGSLSDAIQQKLERGLEEYLSGMQDPTSIYQLQYALNHDQELNDLIERRAGSTAVPALLDVIDRHLK